MRLGCYTTRGRYRPSDPANSTLEDLFQGSRSKNCPICIVLSERRLLCCERGLQETPVEGINLKESPAADLLQVQRRLIIGST